MSNLLAFAVYIVAIFLNPVKREVVHVLRLVAVFGLWSFVGDSTTAVAGHAENEIFLNSSNDADSIANVFVITEPESLPLSNDIEASLISEGVALDSRANNIVEALNSTRDILTGTPEEKKLARQGFLFYTAQNLAHRPVQGVGNGIRGSMWAFKKAGDVTAQCYQQIKQKIF